MKAMKAAIPVVDPLSLGIPEEIIATGASKVTVLSYESPQERPPVKIIDGETPEEKVKNLIKALKEDAKVL
jgi:electron transfer flavoprotein alpha/beta subunit